MIDRDDLYRRVVATLQDMVRFDTTNPPGNETPLALYIRDRLAAEGIGATVLEPAPGRGNVIGRIQGDGTRRPLLLLSHIDVVTAEADHWQRPPFSGDIADGYLWGRGSLDTKGLTAIELETMLMLKRLGLPLKRDLILAATADEEAGGSMGMGWLAQHHFDLVDAEYALNEGGGMGIQVGDHWFFGCQTAEKGSCWTKVIARGDPGHGSMPPRQTAVTKLVSALNRLSGGLLPQHRVATMEAYIKTISELAPAPMSQVFLGLLNPETEEACLAQIPDKAQQNVLRSSLRNSTAVTILRAGQKVNVIPSVAEAEIDCRILPGQTAENAVAEMRAYLGDEVELEVVRTWPGTESAYDTPMFDTIRQVMKEAEPTSVVVPSMVTGATDGRYLAWRGVKVYGFCPLKVMPNEPSPLPMIHGHNERASLEGLRFGTQVLCDVIYRMCT